MIKQEANSLRDLIILGVIHEGEREGGRGFFLTKDQIYVAISNAFYRRMKHNKDHKLTKRIM